MRATRFPLRAFSFGRRCLAIGARESLRETLRSCERFYFALARIKESTEPSIYMYVCMYVYISLSLYIYIYKCVYIHVSLSLYIYIYIYTCVYIYIYIRMCIIHINIYMYIYDKQRRPRDDLSPSARLRRVLYIVMCYSYIVLLLLGNRIGTTFRPRRDSGSVNIYFLLLKSFNALSLSLSPYIYIQ